MDEIPGLLRRPYMWTIMPDSDGSFFGQIIEFPGCYSVGDTPEEALRSLREVAADWLAAAISQGQDIPKPIGEAAIIRKALNIV